ncbi:MAG: hypothetical protein Fur0018_17620 [Anaerolineales bacterium]
MNAIYLWVVLPLMTGVLLLILPMPRRVSLGVGAGLAISLALAAFLLRIGQPLPMTGRLLGDTFRILGRSLILPDAARPWLAFWFFVLAVWLLTCLRLTVTPAFPGVALIGVSLWIAALSVEPFVYAAILIFLALLVWLPVLLPDSAALRAVQRFFTLQLLAVPFLLFIGWMLAGTETLPGQGSLALRAGLMLALGLTFSLGVFPFHTWYPALSEAAPVIPTGFLLALLPVVGLHIAALFLQRYAWLRDAPQTVIYLLFAGRMTFVAAGVLAALETRLARLWGYALMAETGALLLALRYFPDGGIGLFAAMLLPHGLLTWLGTFVLAHLPADTRFSRLQGLFRRNPWLAAGFLAALGTAAGLPSLPAFPVRMVLWQWENASLWVLIGQIGLWIAFLRTLSVFLMGEPPEKQDVLPRGTRLLLGIGISLHFLVGLFPRFFFPLMDALTAIFPHL